MKYFFTITILIFCILVTKAQVSLSSAFERLPINLNFEKGCNGKEEIKREDSDVVIFSFFQDISDTITIFVNKKELKKSFLLHDSTLVSTDYTGFDFPYYFKERNNTITVVYSASKSFIEFELDKKFPIYSIHFYKNGNYYVSGRKCEMVIK